VTGMITGLQSMTSENIVK